MFLFPIQFSWVAVGDEKILHSHYFMEDSYMVIRSTTEFTTKVKVSAIGAYSCDLNVSYAAAVLCASGV